MRARELIGSIVLCGLLSASAGARPPWKPQISVEALDRPAGVRLRLSAEQRALFVAAFRQGRRLLALGQYDQALLSLERASRLDPNHVGVRRARARALLTLAYLQWNRALAQRALADVRFALWRRPADRRLRGLESLLGGLLKRMDRVDARRSAAEPPARARPRSPRRSKR